MRNDSDRQSKSYDVSVIAGSLVQLHEHVTRTLERIEMTRPGSDERVVMISKRELESLEKALEILSATEEVRDLSDKIAQLAAATGPMAHAADA
jgi:PHD/YefM family antitoxin component YafN of YafNO toxin-antitoxin module